MPQPKDKELYERIKNEITNKYKPSAYRSGMIVRKYKEEYYKKHKIIIHTVEIKIIVILKDGLMKNG